MKEEITSRFIEYCESKNIRQITLIEKGLGSKQTINFIWNGKQQPTLKFLSKFLIQYPDANANWLITGKGEMLNEISEYKIEDNLSMVAEDGQLCMKCARKEGIIMQLESEKEKLIDRLERQAEEIGKLKK